MADNDFIIEEPETLDINPEKKEEVISVQPAEELISFDVPTSNSNLVSEKNVTHANTPIMSVESSKLEPIVDIIEPTVSMPSAKPQEPVEVLETVTPVESEPEILNLSAQTSSQAPVYNEVSPAEAMARVNADTLNAEVKVAPVNVTPVTEESIIKEVATATPNKINDDVLKVEDTLLTNNLKDEIKKVEQERDEEAQNRKARIFIIAIFVLLGLTILLLPLLTNIFS